MHKVALLIGVNRYKQDFDDLTTPYQDVEAMEGVLASVNLGGFDAVHRVADRLRGVGTKTSTIEKSIEAALDSVERDGMFLLYFSGHGFREQRELILATSDTDLDEPSSGVSATYLKRVLDSAHHCAVKIVVLDCCHAGAFLARLGAKGGEGRPGLQNAEFGRGTWILSATEAHREAQAGIPDHYYEDLSAFTAVVVQGIESGRADLDGDGLISVEDLYRYTDRELPFSANQRPTLSAIDIRQGGKAVVAQSPTPPEPTGKSVSYMAEMTGHLSKRQQTYAETLLRLEEKLERLAKEEKGGKETEAYMWVAHAGSLRNLNAAEKELAWRLREFESASDGRRLVALGFLGVVGYETLEACRAIASAIAFPRSEYELDEALLMAFTRFAKRGPQIRGMMGEAVLYRLYAGDVKPGSPISRACYEIMRQYFNDYASESTLEIIKKYTDGKLEIDELRRAVRVARRMPWYQELRGEGGW